MKHPKDDSMDEYITLSEVRERLREFGIKEVPPSREHWHTFRKKGWVWPCKTDDQGNVKRSSFDKIISQLGDNEE